MIKKNIYGSALLKFQARFLQGLLWFVLGWISEWSNINQPMISEQMFCILTISQPFFLHTILRWRETTKSSISLDRLHCNDNPSFSQSNVMQLHGKQSQFIIIFLINVYIIKLVIYLKGCFVSYAKLFVQFWKYTLKESAPVYHIP